MYKGLVIRALRELAPVLQVSSRDYCVYSIVTQILLELAPVLQVSSMDYHL